MTSSEPYVRFLRTFFDPPQRDGPDFRVLDELTPAERERAEELMLDRLVDSPVAMQGLAYLRSANAVAPLRALMQRKGAVSVDAAIALWDIRPDREAFALLCRTVEYRPRWRRRHERVAAAAKLTHIDRREALAALITALDDRDIAVSANAEGAVRERLRLNAEADARRSGYMSLREYRALAWAALDRYYPEQPSTDLQPWN
jgi:hypothetical protein